MRREVLRTLTITTVFSLLFEISSNYRNCGRFTPSETVCLLPPEVWNLTRGNGSTSTHDFGPSEFPISCHEG
jgi:hypothetical protein